MWFLNLCYLLQIWNKVLSSGVETIGTTLGSITWLVCILQRVLKIEIFWSIIFSPVMWPIQNALREKCINTDQEKLHIWILFRHWWLQWITFLMRRFLSRHGRLENLKIVIFYQNVQLVIISIPCGLKFEPEKLNLNQDLKIGYCLVDPLLRKVPTLAMTPLKNDQLFHRSCLGKFGGHLRCFIEKLLVYQEL